MELLRVNNVTKRFGGIHAVRDVSFVVKEGQIKGIIGPNRAGKTTIINLISGVFKPTSGEIIYREQNINGMRPHKIARQGIGRTFQNILLFNRLSVFENILAGCYVHSCGDFLASGLQLPRIRRAEIKASSEVTELIGALGLETETNRMVSELPLAKQRSVELARALAMKPQLLLLDEPAAGLTADEVDTLRRTIEEVHRQKQLSILVVEHNMRLAMNLCHNILVLNLGEVLDEGTPAEIRQSESVIDAYLGGRRRTDVAG